MSTAGAAQSAGSIWTKSETARQGDGKLSQKSKLAELKRIVSETGGLAVAFSGGVDSSLLLAVAAEELGGRALAVTADSPTLARAELERARRLAAGLGVEHVVIQSAEMSEPGFAQNPPDRCFICKRHRMEAVLALAREMGYAAVADGENADDDEGLRPGARATAELGILKPLKDAGLTKGEIRDISLRMGLETAEVPSNACLATRLPYGDEITPERLARIEAAEGFLHGLGYELVRVRSHGDVARIEVALERVASLSDDETRERVSAKLRELGFSHVAVDLAGYRMGSMDSALRKDGQS